jgi:uncharacterized protein (DUF433 family)
MERQRLRRFAAGALALATIGGTGGAAVALAYGGDGSGAPTAAADPYALPAADSFASRLTAPAPQAGLRLGGRLFLVDLSAAARYLGLSPSDLLAQLRSGKTLAQIAAATPGKSVSGLVDALVAAAKTKLDAAVQAGRLTQSQEQTLLEKLRDGIAAAVNGNGPKPGLGLGSRPGFGAALGFGIQAAASYLGLSQADLLAQLRSGKTLAQIAAATPGKSVSGLVDALVAAAKTKLDAAVQAGRLTQSQEQAILGKLKDGVTALVNGTAPKLAGPGRGMPPRAPQPGASI